MWPLCDKAKTIDFTRKFDTLDDAINFLKGLECLNKKRGKDYIGRFVFECRTIDCFFCVEIPQGEENFVLIKGNYDHYSDQLYYSLPSWPPLPEDLEAIGEIKSTKKT
ncbi:uncharacterized protein KGF55_004431 [Candida pseudojiufengensis]|uniref:uncharacterized protein n=1 Tax=Candida pseudojiufengensis TaxID=497109 RepID=UPI002225A19F|nr:uncharacterized protein KGF55_004431 [Candida pseudojiufengensis]KAI5960538.1 hypothetical protein KGF55_004431 [Candida pseudojiufengensis]